jgi:hypothetical protein
MTLKQAWNLIESLNYSANQQASELWLANNITEAISYQSACFRQKCLELDSSQQQLVQYWINHDDEFQDYFKCLSGVNNFINSV